MITLLIQKSILFYNYFKLISILLKTKQNDGLKFLRPPYFYASFTGGKIGWPCGASELDRAYVAPVEAVRINAMTTKEWISFFIISS